MSFNSNIPQPTDLISVSQSDLLNNFTSMQSTYTTDHYGFNPITNLGFHKHVTMGNDPANIPTPTAGFGAEFATTVNAATYPFWVRDNSTTQYPMLPFKAFALFATQGAGAPISSFTLPYANVASITRTGVGVFAITFVDTFPNITYGGMANFNNLAANQQVTAFPNTPGIGTVQVATTGATLQDGFNLIMVTFIF